jgi:hypothetical protein
MGRIFTPEGFAFTRNQPDIESGMRKKQTMFFKLRRTIRLLPSK